MPPSVERAQPSDSWRTIVEDECAPRADATGKRPCSERGLSAVARTQDHGTVPDVGVGVAVVGLGAGALLLFVWPGADAAPEASAAVLRPWLTGGSARVAAGLEGSW